MSTTVHQLIILGSGPAGLTAGIYAARAHLKPLIIEGATPGGQLMGTTIVENWPGDREILGPELMLAMRQQALDLGCTLIQKSATSVDLTSRPFLLQMDDSTNIHTHSLIIATGATPKRLGCSGEDTYWGKGVTTCAVCDGPFYKDKPIVIVGGGDTAMENASFMLRYTKNITLVHITKTLTASRAMQDRVLKNPDITFHYESTVTDIQGDTNHVTHARITHLPSGKSKIVPTNAIFIAIGFSPNTSIFTNQLELTAYGHLKTTHRTHTSVPGVFAAGDVADAIYRQAITSAGTGCMAALDAERYLQELDL